MTYWEHIREFAALERKGNRFPEANYCAMVEQNDIAYPRIKEILQRALAKEGINGPFEIRQNFSESSFVCEIGTDDCLLIQQIQTLVERCVPVKYSVKIVGANQCQP